MRVLQRLLFVQQRESQMSSIHTKSHAREGRGGGNGHNDNWRNSPLWDSIEKKGGAKKEAEVVVKQTPMEELSEKERMKRAMALAY